MIQAEWKPKIEFALTAPLDDLIDESVRVVGTLEGDLEQIQPEDITALER